MAKKITSWLLLILVLSLGFGQLLRFEVLSLPFYLHDLLVILLILLQLPSRKRLRSPLFFKLIILGLFLGWLRALTLFPLSTLTVPFLYSLRLISYLVLYLLLKQSKITIHPTILFLSGMVSLLLGLLQYFFLPDMRIFQYLGWDDHLFRLTLPHFDPTYSAAMLSLFFLSLPAPRKFTSTFLYTLGILLSYARSIWLSLLATGLFFLKKKKLFFLLLLIFPLIFFVLPRQAGEGTNLLRTYSISSRLTHDLSLASQVDWNFFLGQGYNTISLFPTSSSEFPLHAHGFNNSFLEILATMGVIGLLGWILFLTQLATHPRLRPLVIFLSVASLFNNLLLYPFCLLLLLLLPFKAPSES